MHHQGSGGQPHPTDGPSPVSLPSLGRDTHPHTWGSSDRRPTPRVGHKGWANGLHTVDLECEPAQSLSDTLWNANFLTDPPGAWLGHLSVGCRARGVREVTLSQSQSREWLGTLRKAGEQGDGPPERGPQGNPSRHPASPAG